METIDCKTWEEFETYREMLVQQRIDKETKTGRKSSQYLYRGQRNHNWHLETTLERAQKIRMSLSDYHRLICRVKAPIETFTGKDWSVLDPMKFDEWL
jgi:hypothetical protein